VHCLACGGGSALEATFCGITDCALWEHRLGCLPKSRVYQERVARALKSHPAVVEELCRAGVDMAFFSFEHAKKGLPGANDPRARVEAGDNIHKGGDT